MTHIETSQLRFIKTALPKLIALKDVHSETFTVGGLER